MAKNIRNLVLFKLGWIACVFFAAAGEPLMATLAVIGAGWAILLPTLALVADTITDSAWLEPREDAPVAQRRGVSGYVPAARPVPVPVYEKESNRVR